MIVVASLIFVGACLCFLFCCCWRWSCGCWEDNQNRQRRKVGNDTSAKDLIDQHKIERSKPKPQLDNDDFDPDEKPPPLVRSFFISN